jgi:hypothetical protein
MGLSVAINETWLYCCISRVRLVSILEARFYSNPIDAGFWLFMTFSCMPSPVSKPGIDHLPNIEPLPFAAGR